MFQDKYRRDMEAVGPSREQLDRLMAAMKTKEEKPVKKRVLRTALVAAALCAALVATALAASPTLREALAQALGLFAPYSREVEGISVTDQGIQVRVVSALSDGNAIVVYFEAQDLTGDRLDAFTTTNTQIEWPENKVEWRQGSLFPTEQIAYDEETKTALYRTKFIGDGVPARGLTIPLYGQVFSPGSHSFDQQQPLPDEVISDAVLRTEKLPDDSVALAPLQNPTLLLDGHLTLSSCGFGEDGRFHIQLAVKTGTIANLQPTVQSREFLNGQKAYGEAKHYPMDRETRFDRDGMTYYDFSYQGAREDADDMVIGQLIAIVCDEKVKGEWRLSVPLENAPARTVDLQGSGTDLGGVHARTLFLTAIGATAQSDPNGSGWTLGYEMTVYLADGTLVRAGKQDSTYYSSDYATDHWTFPQPIDPEEVTAVALGLWYIPIENGAAQSGHWLTEQP